MSRRPLLTVLAAATIGLAACGSADVADEAVAAPSPAATAPATEDAAPPTEDAAPSVEDEGPGTDVVPATPATEESPTAVEDEGPGTDTPPAPAADPAADGDGAVQPVTLTFDGREVPVAEACTGVDGAILATTEGEVTITLVREEGTVLRYQAEGSTAETDEVAVEGGTDTTTYRATLSSPEVAPLAVALVVMDDATAALSPC